MRIEPTLRPELTSVVASVALPAYLGRPEPQRKDVRGGAVSLVLGSVATFTATASRELRSAQVDGQSLEPGGATVTSPPAKIEGSRKIEFRWQDKFGLAGKEPFTLSITGREDEAPSITCEDLPRQKVVLDTELLSFKVRAQDDFGIKQIGIDWQGIDNPIVSTPAKGERILSAGGHDKESLEISGTFSARSLGIEPQPVQVRLFAEDYLPGRERVYSPTYTFYVLNAEQHAIWVTEQLSKWHRQSLEVRDKEMQLYETNKQLRALRGRRARPARDPAQDREPGRRRAGQRPPALGLTVNGEDLIKQAMRNPEFSIASLEKWAEMLQILKDIAGNRMPSVADLLKEAAQAPSVAMAVAEPTSRGWPGKSARADRRRHRSPATRSQSRRRAFPRSSTGNRRSSRPTTRPARKPAKSKSKTPRLTLARDDPGRQGRRRPSPRRRRPKQKVDEAVVKQQDLLAEFDKIADELNRVLANLEGSTLLKRLKAASRLQSKVGGRISDQVSAAFGVAGYRLGNEPAKVLGEMSRARGQGQPRRLADHGRHARLLRAQAVHAVQDGARRDAAARRRRQLAHARRRGEEGKRPVDRPVRILVGHARPLGRRPGRSGGRAAPATPSRRAASPLPWCWRRFRSWKARSTCGKRRAWPSRPSPRSWPTITSSRPCKLSGTQKGLNDRVDKLGVEDS